MSSTTSNEDYYVPHGTHWPIIGSIGLCLTVVGFANYLHDNWSFTPVLVGQVVSESLSGMYNKQVDATFRWSMSWFIFSEVMFFGAFFGALFYAREFAIPWLGGASNNDATAQYLWPNFQATWPLLNLPSAESLSSLSWASSRLPRKPCPPGACRR